MIFRDDAMRGNTNRLKAEAFHHGGNEADDDRPYDFA